MPYRTEAGNDAQTGARVSRPDCLPNPGLPAQSNYYYRSTERDDPALQAALVGAAGEWPTYGYRRLTAQLRRAQWVINNKRVRRLMGQLGLIQKVRRQKQQTTNSEHPFARYPNVVQDLEVVRPDQVSFSDVTYIRLAQEFVYLAVIMDVFTRGIRGWQLSRQLDQELTLTVLRRALEKGQPPLHHSDQGIQYAASAYVDLLKEAQAQISMAEMGQPRQNGHVERLIRKIKEEEVELAEYQDFAEAYRQIGRFLEDVYMHKRIHSSLGYLTPAEFESQWWAQYAPAEVVP